MDSTDTAASWRTQLSKLKDKVVEEEKRKEQERKEEEKRREVERKLQIQRTKEGIAEHLRTDTPEALHRTLRSLQDAFRAGGRELCPVGTMLTAATELDEFGEKIAYYMDSLTNFADAFPAAYRDLLPRLQASIKEAKDRSAKQVAEWSNVKIVTEGTEFRGIQPEDEPTLIHVAKTFYQKAHGIDLNLPKNFFSKKAAGFHVATFQEIPYAYVEVGDIKDTVTLAVGEVIGTNFTKLVRGFMYIWCQKGPVGKTDTISVRVTSRDEVKFYTALNFIRSGTRGMSDWTYSRKVV